MRGARVLHYTEVRGCHMPNLPCLLSMTEMPQPLLPCVVQQGLLLLLQLLLPCVVQQGLLFRHTAG